MSRTLDYATPPPAPPALPTAAKVIAWLFIGWGVLAALGILMAAIEGNVYFDLTPLGILIGWGLLRRSPRWRDVALLFIWIGMIVTAYVGVVFALGGVGISGRAHVSWSGEPVWDVPQWIFLFVAIPSLILLHWEYRILTRADVRHVFGLKQRYLEDPLRVRYETPRSVAKRLGLAGLLLLPGVILGIAFGHRAFHPPYNFNAWITDSAYVVVDQTHETAFVFVDDDAEAWGSSSYSSRDVSKFEIDNNRVTVERTFERERNILVLAGPDGTMREIDTEGIWPGISIALGSRDPVLALRALADPQITAALDELLEDIEIE